MLTEGITYLHLETDASLNPARTDTLPDGTRAYFAGGGVVLRSIAMRPVQYESVPLGFVRSVIEAEALAFLSGMETASLLGARTVRARSDSAPLVGFLNGTASFREPYLEALGERLLRSVLSIQGFQMLWSHSHHGRTRGDRVPSVDYLARVAAGLETRSSVRRRRRRAGCT
jgi:ribonuclease HI